MTEPMTETLARFIVETPPGSIPEAAFEKSEKAIVDSLSCILLGSSSEVAGSLKAYLDQMEGGGSRIVLGLGRRSSAETAALVNATFGHAEDYDDVLSMIPAHPSVPILSAVFASMGEGLSGADLIDAHIVGVEVGAKIGLAIGNGHYKRGWHATGSIAIFCALAALARALRLDLPTTRQAFGIAASMASGLRGNFGTMTKPFHAGLAAHNAVVAVRLARSGFTAADNIMERDAGFFSTYGTPQSDMARGLSQLGRPFAIVDPGLALKKYPCAYPMHRAIDAMLRLRANLGITPANTAEVVCRVAPGALRILPFDRPKTGLEGKFSMEYALAVGILDGRYDCAAFGDDAVRRPEIQALFGRVRKEEVASFLDSDPDHEIRSSGTIGHVEVTARRTDGVAETVRVDRPTGSPQHELTWGDLEEKFLDCASHAGFAADIAGNAFAAWRKLHDSRDVSELLNLLDPKLPWH